MKFMPLFLLILSHYVCSATPENDMDMSDEEYEEKMKKLTENGKSTSNNNVPLLERSPSSVYSQSNFANLHT